MQGLGIFSRGLARRIIHIIALCLLASFSCIALSSAKIINVPSQFTTIQQAIDVANVGDVVVVGPNTYFENIVMKEGITLIGTDKLTSVIHGTVRGAPYTTIENLQFVDDNSGATALYSCYGCVGVKLRNNIFVATTAADGYIGILLSGWLEDGITPVNTPPGTVSAELINNVLTITSSGYSLTGVDMAHVRPNSGYNVRCLNNSIYLQGASGETRGLFFEEPSHLIKNNIIEVRSTGEAAAVCATASTQGRQRIDFNFIVGKIDRKVDAGPTNIRDISTVFMSPEPAFGVLDKSLAVGAAEPAFLYQVGAEDIGVFGEDIMVSDTTMLQFKIDNASPGETVIVEPGYYTFTDDLRIEKNIVLKARLSDPDKTVFNLGEHVICIKDTSIRSWHRLQNRYVEADEYHYLNAAKITQVTLEGFTITGYRENLAKEGYGPDQFISDAVRAIEDNGPIQNYGRHLRIKNCKIVDNHGIKVSGVYTMWRSSVTLEDTLIAKNRNFDPGFWPSKPWAAYGAWSGFTNPWSGQVNWWKRCGVLFSNGNGFTIRNCTIADNVNDSQPDKVVYGAIFMNRGNLSIHDTIMWHNGDNDIAKDCAGREPKQYTDISHSDFEYTGFIDLGVTTGVISESPQFINPRLNDYTPQNPYCAGMGVRF